MKIVLAGSTGHAGYVLQGLEKLPDARLAGFAAGCSAEPSEEFAHGLHGKYGAQVYPDYCEMLDRVQPDVLGVASFASVNGAIVLEAIRRGVHVFVEKPGVATLQELASIREACRCRPDVQISMMLPYRYDPLFDAVKRHIRRGDIGQPALLTAQKSYKGAWSKIERYGSTLMWIGAHMFDWMTWLTDARAVSVTACRSRAGNRDESGCDAAAGALLQMERGIIGVLHADYLRPLDAAVPGDDRLRIAGTEGIVEIRDKEAVLLRGDRADRIAAGEPAKDMFEAFIHQIEGKGPCRISAGDSFDLMELCLKAQQSADQGMPVAI